MTAQADTPSLEGSYVALHRKSTHRSKVLAAAVGVGLTVSGVAYAAQAAHESMSSASDPIGASSAPHSLVTSTPEQGRAGRDARPTRGAATRRPALRDEHQQRRGDRRKRGAKPSQSRLATPVTSAPASQRVPAKETTSATPEMRTPTAASRTQTPRPTSRSRSSGSGILGGTNAARADAGLPALGVSSCLAGLAQRHAERLATAGRLYHQDLGNVMRTCGMSAAGENVAMNYSRPSDMVQQWLNSPGHRANMLSSRFSLIGVGVAQAADGAWYGVQVFGDG